MSEHKNFVRMSVSGTPGTGTITLGSAVSGFQSFASAYAADATVDVSITDGTAWEVARACTYTNSGTTLTRGTFEASSTGSALSLTGAAIVTVTATAEFGNNVERLMRGLTPGGRLTTESGVPVSTSDRTAQSTLYYTPFVHDQIVLWDSASWRPYTFTETSLALSGLTSGKPYDVFGYVSSGVLAVELLVWTNDTTRATAVTLQDGRYCKSGDKTRLLLGTIYTTSTTTTEDSATKRFVSNVYNKVGRAMSLLNSTSHSYNGGYRYWNNDSSLRLQMVVADPQGLRATFPCAGEVSAPASRYAITAQRLDGSSSYDGIPAYLVGASGGVSGAVVQSIPTGYHYIAAVESSASLGASTFNTVYLAGEVFT